MEIKKFKDFFTEALSLSQYRAIYKDISDEYRERYADWFEGKWRVFLPLSTNADPVYAEIQQALGELNYEIADWKGGLAKSKTSNKIQRIGRLLTSAGLTDKLKKFNERFQGKVAAAEDDYTVVISRHPYDIAGMSTDRAWESCKNIVNGCNRHFIPTEIDDGALIAYVIKTSDIKAIRYSDPNVFTLSLYNISFEKYVDFFTMKKFEIDTSNFHHEDNSDYVQIYFIVNVELKTVVVTDDEDEKQGKIYSLQEFDKKMDKLLSPKDKKLKQDVLATPISRLLIIPVVDNEDEPALYVGDKFYGKSVKGFRKVVEDWVYEQQGFVTDPSLYRINTDRVYDDDYEELGRDMHELMNYFRGEGFETTDNGDYFTAISKDLRKLDDILANDSERARYRRCVSVYFDAEEFVELEMNAGWGESWKYSQVKDWWDGDIDINLKEELYEKYIAEDKREEISIEDFSDDVEDYISGFTEFLCEKYNREDLYDLAIATQKTIKSYLYDYDIQLLSADEWKIKITVNQDNYEQFNVALSDAWSYWRELYGVKTIGELYEDVYDEREGVNFDFIEDMIRDEYL